MARFAAATGRQYRLFEYDGDAGAERVLVIMGSGAETARAAAAALRAAGEKVGVVQVRLYRPFSAAHVPCLERRKAARDGAAVRDLYRRSVKVVAGARNIRLLRLVECEIPRLAA